MSARVEWFNPYRNREGRWYKGNLHTHTSPDSPCASIPRETMVDLYEKAGYDFLAISDHMHVARRFPESSLILFPAIEWNSSRGEHTGVVSLHRAILQGAIRERNHGRLLRALGRSEAFVVLHHPNWGSVPHYPFEDLGKKWPFDALEIYNAVIERLEGEALATGKWDFLLSQGRRVLGVAGDDSHLARDIGQAWIAVRAPARTKPALFRAIRQGNFYCSSGVVFQDIRREGDRIVLETNNAEEIHAVGAGGRRLARVQARTLCFDLSTAGVSAGYVRFVAFGPGSSQGWTQPFFFR